MDNTEIARIATPELSEDALALLRTHQGNDDVVFFLGRLVWQGNMVNCVPLLSEIACNPSRGHYARRAAIRGVMSVGDADQKDALWTSIVEDAASLNAALLAEILEWAPANMRSVELLLRTLELLPPLERFSATGLEQALHSFIDRLPMMADGADSHPIGHFASAINELLEREPVIERRDCHISQKFAWLMAPALHAIDLLVDARSSQALKPAALNIIRNAPALSFWRRGGYEEYQAALSKNVPRWTELNDLLYWSSIEEVRARRGEDERILNDWQIIYAGHFWKFDPSDFERCLGWVQSKVHGDDRAVALYRSVQIYFEANRPDSWLPLLRAAVEGNATLSSMLAAQLEPVPSSGMVKYEAERRHWERKHKAQERKERKNRSQWVKELKENPDRVRHPPGLKPGDVTNDHYHLLHNAPGDQDDGNEQMGSNWQALILEFGEEVASAYRDAALAHWRVFKPGIGSEGADTTTFSFALIFAMAGLSIEASENNAFPHSLAPSEAHHVFRYITWRLNGFPRWFEALYRAFPEAGYEAVKRELIWELERTVPDRAFSYILQDILYDAPWLHAEAARLIVDWMQENNLQNSTLLGHCLDILAGGGIDANRLAELASRKAKGRAPADQMPRWFALWVDVDPKAAIPALEATMVALPFEAASTICQEFIVGLVGQRHGTGPRVGAYRNVRDLKRLYLLMHRFIRASDDINRANGGVYSPGLRDNAQDGRDSLFQLISVAPGAEAYSVLKELEREHPDPSYRGWMAKRAIERAIADADEPLWTVEQVNKFSLQISRMQ